LLPEQRPFAVVTALALAGMIVWLVRRRRLREEYALLWLAVAAVIVAVAVFSRALLWLTALIGAVDPTSTLFIFSLLFLLVVSLHFSVVNSRLKDQVRDLTQEIALLRREVEKSLGRTVADHENDGSRSG
jgi:hypothetical protein